MNDDVKEELKDCYAEIKRLRADSQKAALDYLGQIGQLSDEITRLRAALEEAIEFADQAEMALTPRGEAYVARWRAALDGQPAPSGWRPDALVTAANAIIDFYNGPAQAKRPDIFQRLMQRLANALPPAPRWRNAHD